MDLTLGIGDGLGLRSLESHDDARVRDLPAPHPAPRAREVPPAAVIGHGTRERGVGENAAADVRDPRGAVASVRLQPDRPRSPGQRIPTIPFVDAMSFGGGPSTTDKAKLLLHHAVAALLNSTSPDVDYPWLTADVISETNAALASGDKAEMQTLKNVFDADNNAGCPLN